MAEPKKQDAWSRAAEDFYDRCAAQKNNPDFRNAFVRSYRRLNQRLPFSSTPSPHVLDLGCGTGELSQALQLSGWRVTGIDISEESLKLARQYLPAAEFQRASMTALPFPGGHFEAVIAMTSLEFCQDKKTALQEAKRVLKPEGFFYVEVRNAGFCMTLLPHPLLKMLKRFKLLVPYPAHGFRDLRHEEWARLFQEAGFTLEKQFSSLRPWNYGSFLTRAKNLFIEFSKALLPIRYQYMTGFLLKL